MTTQFIELLLLAALWGASFLFMRVAAPELGPIPLVALRVGIAALCLLPSLFAANAMTQFRTQTKPLLVLGIINSAIPFCLLGYAALYMNAGFSSILNATTPIWAAVIAFVWLNIPLKFSQVLGLLIGLLGVATLVWEKIEGSNGVTTLAIFGALLATIFYGFGVNYSKRNLAGIPSSVIAFGSQFYAALFLVPLAVIYWPTHAISWQSWVAAGLLGVLCTGLAFILYFRLIEHAGATYAASVTFLIPIFGVAWAAIFLNEKVTLLMMIGGAIVVLGTAMATGRLAYGAFKKPAIATQESDSI